MTVAGSDPKQGAADDKLLLSEVAPSDWPTPSAREPYNLVVIGAGTAGLVAAKIAAGLGARVALIEKSMLGGDCLNVGCVPSKALLRSASLCADIRRAGAYGVESPGLSRDFAPDFAAAMRRMRQIRARLGRTDSAESCRRSGVDVYFGEARFVDDEHIAVGGVSLTFKKALIATGARPVLPAIEGIDAAGYLTNETIFDLTVRPRRLCVIGGGPLGCEIAQAFQRLGSEVTIIHQQPLFLPREERDAAQLLSQSFGQDGINVRLNTLVTAVEVNGEEKIVHTRSGRSTERLTFDAIFTGLGRAPVVSGLDLTAVGVASDSVRGVHVDDYLQTTNPRIYAAGDVCLQDKYTHTAEATARMVVQNALFRGRQKLSDLVIPWCTYTDPEIAHVGTYFWEANAQKIPLKTFTILLSEVDRPVIDGEELGFVKIHVRDGSDKILGATIVARHAGDMIQEISLAMTHGIGLGDLAKVIHPYPTQAEAIKRAANAYLKTRLTPRLKKISTAWLRWTW